MVQYNIIKEVYQSNEPMTESELVRTMDLTSRSIQAQLKKCVRNGYLRETDKGYVATEKVDEDELERIRPKTLNELSESKNE